MFTVNEVSKLAGVSVRTLHYYDKIDLLKPAKVKDSGYRLYGDSELERLQQILLFRELEFPLKEIKEILDSPNFDRNEALRQQIELLTLRKEHLENLIDYARGIEMFGVKKMSFEVFDTRKIDEYARQAKENWGKTKEYKEFEENAKSRTKDQEKAIMDEFMDIFREFGKMKELSVEDEKVQVQVCKLKQYICDNFYDCSNKILAQLGVAYGAGGDMTENIDKVGGKGTGEFTNKAIEYYVIKNT